MRRGFTLVELTLVVILIAILAALALPQFTRMKERGKMAAAKAKLDVCRKAEGIWHAINDTYTNSFDDLDDEVPEAAEASLDDADWDFSILAADATSFTIQAKRRRGNYTGKTITIDQDGTITDYAL